MVKQRGSGQQDTAVGTSCCAKESIPSWVVGTVDTKAGPIPRVSTELSIRDKLGSWKVRWGFGRENYEVEPGLYCVGEPDPMSAVLVTANYKMSFDTVRRALGGMSAWILVLDTNGVNVWCAAGKGTFGTDELVHRIEQVALSQIVEHSSIVLPQLGAPGVAAHEVRARTGFRVLYGPVRAWDIPEFLARDQRTTAAMRRVRFTLLDRLVLTPVELVGALRISLMVFGAMFVLNQVGLGSFGLVDFWGLLGALLVGCVLVPVLLPWIPGRSFAFKGWLLGVCWTLYLLGSLYGIDGGLGVSVLQRVGYMLALPAVSSFCALNFTGSSTYTSLSGVVQEMRFAIPAIVGATVIGAILMLVG